MLENRDYMRAPEPGSPFRFRWTVTTVLMVSLVIIYALQCIDDAHLKKDATAYLALTTAGLKSGYFWQLLTFQFLHGGMLHLLFNLISLWFVGRIVETMLGSRRFLTAYLMTGVAGGLLQGILVLLLPFYRDLPLCGASAGLAGVFAIFAMIEGNSEVRWNFIIPVRARNLLILFGAVSLFFTLVPVRGDYTAHAAHLGGLVAGIAWVKLGWHRDYVTLPWEGFFSRWRRWRPLESRQRKHELVRAAKVRTESWKRIAPETPAELPPEEFISKEVDPILDKISQHGLHSLTDRERKILEAARKKMSGS